ncbi:hypothetical protein J2Q11_13015 [Tenacibaculum finnmarkense genomovar finnmarkense]|uniref:hypothetical protein n=1 Tax=Tenacibaculum finnmarkense TaxID=2781243 RepID=UPI001E4FDD6E|nr:hypothetical protein [Tenacibaculum finnmarkense]MCD8418569.1 hypothetical protein [Tenacibaculum finnmarkense genomovar finnmarkense]MCG8186927.1 hypothetical protein [Tenacibaculum finnmarkense genomovar finnmarkense]MCG8203473.1 hypothetical protein [Tenacibaculum finnmarkense genomovar finnmarkense]MCG8210949.1 hypothetical protein [Tenacibaculum finnmarkense genomovar finnmarkense]MCG8213735.1 hypothetical protein [Tenacibaculum finnmarkense genomovar finnmarkense]
MNRIILLYLVSFIFTSCNGQNNKNIRKTQHDMKIKIDSLPYYYINDTAVMKDLRYEKTTKSVTEILKNNSRLVTKLEFDSVIKNIYNIDINSAKTRINIGNKWNKFPEEIILYGNYIIHDSYGFANIFEKGREGISEKNYEAFVHSVVQYNKMVFYNDIEATNWIKIHEPHYLMALVKDYGYTSNKDWLKFSFGDTDFSDPYHLEKFLIEIKCLKYNENYENENFCAKSIAVLRKDMLNKMIELGVELSQLSTIATKIKNSKKEDYEGDNKKLYGYLMERSYAAG